MPPSKGKPQAASAKPVPAKPAEPPSKPIKVKGRGIKSAASAEAAPPVPEGRKFAKSELMMPTSKEAVVNNLMTRKLNDGGPPAEPISNTVKVLVRLSQAVSKGDSIDDIKTDIVRLVAHQPEKTDIFQSVLTCVDRERTADMVEIRAGVEKELKRSVLSGGLTVSESLAVWDIANNIIKENQAKAAKNNKGVDAANVEKVDAHSLETEKVIRQKWEGTTPQGRQIIRMKLFELKRYVAAEIEQAKSKDEPEEKEEPVIDVK